MCAYGLCKVQPGNRAELKAFGLDKDPNSASRNTLARVNGIRRYTLSHSCLSTDMLEEQGDL